MPSTTRLSGPADDIEVHRDEWGVPHVRATTSDDAFFAQGYTHAQDRLFQMDSARRRMEGRWAEWAGPGGVPADTLARRVGAVQACRRDIVSLTDEARRMLASYTAGVNAYLDGPGPLPLEYELLGVEPERWEPWHCLAAMRQRGYLMGSVWFKLWRAAALRAVDDPDVVATLRYDDGGTDRLTIPPGTDAERWLATLADLGPAIDALALLADDDSTVGGSNNWAVAGSRTATGRPLLAGDPHRALEMPSIYAQTHLACDRFDVIGFSIPGVPGFPHFGHNADVAWCVTHAFADIHDLYVERFSDDAARYLFEGRWLPTTRRTERIDVRGGESVDVEVVETHHGPVVAGDPTDGAALTLRSMQFAELDRTFDCLLPMLEAGSCAELFEASRGWGLIDHNVVAADTAGSIAHIVRATVPRRPRLNGWLPVPGWTGEYDWTGMIPWDAMPVTFDPARGYLATANNRLVADSAVGPTTPYLQTDCHPPYRARRVEERLAALPSATREDMLSMHGDVVSRTAPVFQKALAGVDVSGVDVSGVDVSGVDVSDAAADLRDLLVGWDAQMTADSPAAAGYTAFRWALTGVLAERSGLQAVADDPLVVAMPGGIDVRNQLWWALPALVRSDDARLLKGWTWSRAVAEALRRAAEVVDGSPWGEVHTAALAHPLAPLHPEAAERLNPAGASLGGDNDTVFANGCSSSTGTRAVYGAVARYVFDVGSWDDSSWIVVSGSSGRPDDPHYADQHALWAACRTVPMRYDWDGIGAASTLHVLAPLTD